MRLSRQELYWITEFSQPYYLHIKKVDSKLSDLGNFRGGLVLDVGCCVGYDLTSLAELAQVEFAVGIDTNPNYLKESMSRTRKHRISDKVAVVLASAANLPFIDNKFDLITCFSVLEFLHKKYLVAKAIADVSLLLKEEGTFVITAPNYLFIPGTAITIISSFLKKLAIRFPTTLRGLTFTPHELRRMVENAGMRIEDFDAEWPIVMDGMHYLVLPGPMNHLIHAFFSFFFKFCSRFTLLRYLGARMGYRAQKT